MSHTFEWCIDKTRLEICDKQVFRISRHGTRWWFLNGNPHRVDGPAVEYACGAKYWFLNGKEYSTSEYWKALKK